MFADMEIKFLPHDFKGGKLPTAVGAKATVKAFMGFKNVPVVITANLGGCVMAKLAA
jgi:hypothetical protein